MKSKKMMYLVRGSTNEDYTAFEERMRALGNIIALQQEVQQTKVVLTVEPPPAVSIIPFKKKKIAAFSVVGDPVTVEKDIGLASGYTGSFEVSEALPVSYRKSWKDGERTPGICLLTLFRRKRTIDHKTFIDRWHNSHTPLSLKLHPLWHYNRNVVDTCGNNNMESWDGIVEEHCKKRKDLLNPFRFFGDPFRIVPNMLAVYTDTKSFLDYKSIEPYLAVEYHLKS